MRELKEPCKSAITEGRCLGCVGLAETDWQAPKYCIYADKKKDYKFKTKEGEQLKL